jgi:hypothetical protein
MDTELIKTVGQVAGIGGIALGVFLLLFRDLIRKQIFPTLAKREGYRLLRLVAILIWSVALAGIGAWVWTSRPEAAEQAPIDIRATNGVAAGRDTNIGGDVTIGSGTAPGTEAPQPGDLVLPQRVR